MVYPLPIVVDHARLDAGGAPLPLLVVRPLPVVDRTGLAERYLEVSDLAPPYNSSYINPVYGGCAESNGYQCTLTGDDKYQYVSLPPTSLYAPLLLLLPRTSPYLPVPTSPCFPLQVHLGRVLAARLPADASRRAARARRARGDLP